MGLPLSQSAASGHLVKHVTYTSGDLLIGLLHLRDLDAVLSPSVR